MVHFIFNIFILATVLSLILADNPCRLTTSDGTIDISSLSGTDGTPKYKDIQPVGSGFKYSYNPCKAFNEGEHCKGASVCQVDPNGNDQFMLGTQDSAQWIPPPGPGSNWVLRFSYPNPSGLKTVNMNLACPAEGEAETFDFRTEPRPNIYIFDWKNKCLCWNGCKNVTNIAVAGEQSNRLT